MDLKDGDMADTCEISGVESLRDEIAFFESKRAELLLAHEGKFALVKGSDLVGIYDDQAAAYKEGLTRFGNQPFLIKQVARQDPVQSIPALHLGLIRAHS